ncbi:MAG: LCP family protein [Anaerolineae bacterium]|nr:LCP family protein [Anaerolineae bacterium]MDW8172611.1 LCP family protein [Anaerolineae bacterium]
MLARLRLLGLLAGCALLSAHSLPLYAQTSLPSEGSGLIGWDGMSRFNILVLGVDNRPTERTSLSARTDTILLGSYNPQTGEVGVLSIPRDMHVASFDGILQRVNTLLILGERMQKGGGPRYAMDVIGYNLGMTIDAYLLFDFYAFQRLIDALGGVWIDVPYTINDPLFPDMNYGYDPLYLRRGLQLLNGYNALRFARTRHGDNDYVRGQRQLMVLMAVYRQLKDINNLQAFLNQAPRLVLELNGHVYSDLSPQEIVSLGLSMLAQDESRVRVGALNEQYSYFTVSGGSQVRVPNPDKLPELLYSVFGDRYWE